ncbi:MAG: endonuclease domain-containing protein, partial [Chloroflexi bacterium]|nr:endonuclease domain-containing protein [Chloroflexota bacterium]
MQVVARGLRRNPTAAEHKLWQAIRKRQLDGRKFRRQVAIGAFVVDFYCSTERLVVEVDGPIHENQQTADRIRQELIESLGIRFVRLTNDMVENRLQAALEIIRVAFGSSPSKRKVGARSAATHNTDNSAQIDESPLPHFGGGGLGVGASSRAHPATKIVNLYENPATPASAIGVARNILEGNAENIRG